MGSTYMSSIVTLLGKGSYRGRIEPSDKGELGLQRIGPVSLLGMYTISPDLNLRNGKPQTTRFRLTSI